ncbi:SURF1 family protein [Thalassococcus lentus]|uniref:SURF1-like protein n=1 Tax=Thalassococcus lentus TaxID=1210524 RepID=A0ABT4XU42_9RHOB|nr:SURF1 family protein [Thalassococcus lentus]MDA7425484.1 SURF1 family protein [Thalassococcus lentus]
MQRILAPILIGLIGAGILVALGTWQMQRLDWKRGILNEIETTIAGEAQPLPRVIEPSAQQYLPLAVSGTLEDTALFVLVSVKRQGAGWRVISALQTDDGRRVLVDRGFARVDQKDAALFAGPVSIAGNLLWPDERSSATPENDLDKNTWFARDVAQMAEALQTEPLLVVVRQASPSDGHITPLPVDTGGIPNDHLQYAITWFSLAAVWLLMTGVWIRRRVNGKES